MRALALRSGHRVRRYASALPLTARGAVVATLSALALWSYGFGSLDLILFEVGLTGLMLVALALLAVCVTALVLRRRPLATSTALRMEAGSRVATGFSIPGLNRLPLVEVAWQWRTPASVEVRARRRGARLVEEVVAHRRLATALVRRRLVVSDVLGLARVGWTLEEQVPVIALPAIGRLRAAPVVQALATADGIAHPSGLPEGDRMEIRHYVPGDSVRHILWKTYARTRELTVRLPERSVERARKTVAYLVCGAGDEPAAAAARVALESGALGDGWVFGADGFEGATADLETARLAIARSGALAGTGAMPASGLAGFLERQAAAAGVHCVVFAAARQGVWTETVLALARQRRGLLSFVLATDGVSRPQPKGWWRRLLLKPQKAPGTDAPSLDALVRALAATAATVQVVDRSTGRSFGQRLERRWLSGVAA